MNAQEGQELPQDMLDGIEDRKTYLQENHPIYRIGVSRRRSIYSLCLVRKKGSDTDLILVHSTDNEEEFNDDLSKLARLFSAEVIEEK